MNKTFEFLKEKTQVNFVSTIDGDNPSCRPFGDPVLFDNKIYVLTSKTKNVSKQIEKITMFVLLLMMEKIGLE